MLTIPACCWLCEMPLHLAQHGICSACLKALPTPPAVCYCCGLPSHQSDQLCGRCLLHPRPWQQLLFVCDYLPPLRHQIHQLKFSQGTARAMMLARLMLLTWLKARREQQLPRADLLFTVPLHRWRAWRRGYNQLDGLAQALAHWTGIPWCASAIRRVRKGQVQHQLNAAARRHNLRQAFRLETEVTERHIALLDDVVTTGSTVAELSRLLHSAGAASVQIWCLCRTL